MTDPPEKSEASPKKAPSGSLAPFVAVAGLFAIPIFAKAYLWIGYVQLCTITLPQGYNHGYGRLLLPFLLAICGYFIFVLEGAQSSVILANKQSADTLDQILSRIDLRNRIREGTRASLSGIIGGDPIDTFFIGRQLLIIAVAFLFKFFYDASNLTSIESAVLSDSSTVCRLPPSMVGSTYSVLDHWLFSTFVCSVLVAYFFQVPSKLMAQHHPLRFLTTVPGTRYAPLVSQKAGTWSLLGRPLKALRNRGAARVCQGKLSYFAGKEFSPASMDAVFEELANLYGEHITEIAITLSPQSPDKQDTWFVEDDTTYKVLKPSRDFSQAIQVPQLPHLEFDAFAQEPGRKNSPAIKPAINNTRLRRSRVVGQKFWHALMLVLKGISPPAQPYSGICDTLRPF